MAYEEPGVKVIQELAAAPANIQSAQQLLTLVGELYEVFEDEVHSQIYDAVTGAGAQVFTWPGKKSTSVVDLSGVRKSIAEVDSQLNEFADYPMEWKLRDPSTAQVFEVENLEDVYAVDQDGFSIVEGSSAATARASGTKATSAQDAEFHLEAGGFISAGIVTGDRIYLTNDSFAVQGTVVTAQDDHIFYTPDGHQFKITTATSAQATGSLKVVGGATFLDGETFVLDDGTNPAVTFELDDDASVVETPTLRAITFTGAESASQMRDLIIAAIVAAPTLDITPSIGGSDIVSLVNDTFGTDGNVAITETVAAAGFVASGMSGGTSNTSLVAEVVGDPVTLATSGVLVVGTGATLEWVEYTDLSVSGDTHTFTTDAMVFAHAADEDVSLQVFDSPSLSLTDGDLATTSGFLDTATGGLTGKVGTRVAMWVENSQVNDGVAAGSTNVVSSVTAGFTYADVGKKLSIWSSDAGDGGASTGTGTISAGGTRFTADAGTPFASASAGDVLSLDGVYVRITAYVSDTEVDISAGTSDGAVTAGQLYGQVVRTIMAVDDDDITVDGDPLNAGTALPLVLHRAVYRDLVTDSSNSDTSMRYSGSAVRGDTGFNKQIPFYLYEDDLVYEIYPAYELLVTYRALDIASVNNELYVYEAGDLTDIGDVSKANPLLWAAQAALVAMGTSDTAVILLPIDLYADADYGEKTGYPEDHNVALGYLNALDVLEANEAVYFMVPLTRNSTVRDSFVSHVLAMSEPCDKRERVCYLTYDIPLGEFESTTGVVEPGLDGGNKKIIDAGQNFLSQYQLIPGNDVVVTSPAAIAGTYVIGTGSTEDELVLEGDNWMQDEDDEYLATALEFEITNADTTTGGEVLSPTAGVWKDVEEGDYLYHDGETRKITNVTSNGGLLYAKLEYEGLDLSTLGSGQTVSILRTHIGVNFHALALSKGEVATNLKAISQTRANRRVVHMWPDLVQMITGTDAQGNEVREYLPSYYAAAAEAGRDGVIPWARSSTGLALGGFTGLQHSNFYFKKSQLNTIAEGGWAILEQRVAGGNVSMRHLMTTDASTVKTQELSFTKNVDNMAKVTRATVEPLLNDEKGRINITKQFLTSLAIPFQGILENFVKEEQLVQTADAPPYKITSIRQDTTQPDTILWDNELNVPLPANRVTVTFVI